MNAKDWRPRVTSLNTAASECSLSPIVRTRKLYWILALALMAFHSSGRVQSAPIDPAVARIVPGSAAASGSVVPVAAGGKPQAVIALGEAAGESTKFAATELQKYLHDLSGADIAVATDAQIRSGSPQQALVLIGGPDKNPLVKRVVAAGLTGFTGLKPEGFVLKTSHLDKRPVVVAGGNDDAGTMYAVFELVEKLGVTFLLTGDIVPAQRSSLEIPALDLRLEPALGQRGFLMEASHHQSVTMLGYEDYARMIDQMAKMKDNYLMIWWFSYSPFLKFSYHGETKLIGDISKVESAYLNSMYAGGGSQTTDDVTIGKHWYPDRRLVPPEMRHVETPEEAFTAAQNMMQRVIHYAKSRHVSVWLVDEFGSAPPNLARHGERIFELPFERVFGTFMHPLDPVNREIQANNLKALIETYPEAAGYFLNFPEVYAPQNNASHHEFYAQEEPAFNELLEVMTPWQDRLHVGRQEMMDSDIGYFDLFKYLMGKRNEFAPQAKLGLMTLGRGYVMPVFDKMLPKDIPFGTADTGGRCGYGTPQGMPMSYFGGMGARQRIFAPYLDDDCDMLGLQFNVGVYTATDGIFTDGLKNGLTGVAPWMAQPRGTEQNSSFLAEAAWNPKLTMEEFYKDYAARLFGAKASPDMYQAFITLEENQMYLAKEGPGFGREPRPITVPCCGAVPALLAAHDYSLQENPFDGPKGAVWAAFIVTSPTVIGIFEQAKAYLDKALANMHAAEARVEPQGKHELDYLICRTEAYRDYMVADITERRGFLAFDHAFHVRSSISNEEFEAQLDASLKLFEEAHQKVEAATTKYAEIIDHPSDLEMLYHLNAGSVMGFDLVRQWIQRIVNFNQGKPYTNHVAFERIFPGDDVRFTHAAPTD
jgi:Glycosyl hydrolase family 67 N-terminus